MQDERIRRKDPALNVDFSKNIIRVAIQLGSRPAADLENQARFEAVGRMDA
jgi:hypothetical protein